MSPNSKRWRRIAAITAASVAASLVVAGCSGTAGSAESQPTLDDKPVTITMNWWGAASRNDKTMQAIKLFETKYPNIKVNPTNADWSGYWDKLATSTAGGSMPDVSQFDQLYVASYAQRGTLLDLSTVSNTLKTDALPSSVLDTGKVDGKLYAEPIGVSPDGIIVNKSVFKKYDIPLPDFNKWTWDQFDALGAEISKKSGGAVQGIAPFGGGPGIDLWARQHGNNVFGKDGKVTLDPKVLASYWTKELSWVDSGASASAAVLTQGSNLTLNQNDISTGKAAMGFIPGGQVTAYASANPNIDYALGNWPTSSDTKAGFQYLKPSMYWSISSKTEHAAAAATLVNFLTTSPEVGKIFGVDRGLPANPAIQKAITPDLDAASKVNLDFTQAMTKVAGEAPPITPNGASDIQTMMGRYNQEVLFKRKTPEEAASDFIKELQTEITSAG